jgi:flagellar basal body rod protein FlgG
MSSAATIAATGIAAATAGVGAAASNIANALTPGYQPVQAGLEALPEGGVEAHVQRQADPLAAVRADQALLAGQGVDLVQEVVAQQRFARLAEANVKALQAATDLDGELLQVLGRR